MKYMKSKNECYKELVNKRKQCHICNDLVNPADCEGGIYDSNHIGPYSRWQGNIDSNVMVVGQDWGTVKWFVDYRGRESRRKSGDVVLNKTNENLIKLLGSIGINIERQPAVDTRGEVFFTNAILCLKKDTGKGIQSKVKKKWYDDCGEEFLRSLIENLNPKVVITLGTYARDCVLDAFKVGNNNYRVTMKQSIDESPNGIPIGNSLLYPVFHCGARGTNQNRSFDEQVRDWARIKKSI